MEDPGKTASGVDEVRHVNMPLSMLYVSGIEPVESMDTGGLQLCSFH